MEVIDALAIEGGRGYGILCYGIFDLPEFEEAFKSIELISDNDGGAVYRLYSEGWDRGIVLYELELELAEVSNVSVRASLMLDKLMGIRSCLAAFCMFEGAFYNYDDIFSKNVADQIYAFSFGLRRGVVNMDKELLRSREWSGMIEQCRRRIF